MHSHATQNVYLMQYLQYKNVRADYVDAIWQVINWPEVESRFTATA